MKTCDYQHIFEQCKIFSVAITRFVLLVRIHAQTMELFENAVSVHSYTVSTSRRPPSCVEDSLGTPLGLHCIDGKIGAGEPLGRVFKGRVPQAHLYTGLPTREREAHLITTRILRLRGLEPGVNRGPGCDSYDRYIYIHGTNHEDHLGMPDSHGCVCMANADVLDLFERVPDGSLVYITQEVRKDT